MLSHEFVRNAYLAATPIALACGLAGYFLVLRAQVFAGDALSHVAFTGALAAAAAGVDVRAGLFGATVAIALGMGALGRGGRPDDVAIGSVFAWVLGLGVLCLSIFTRSASGSGDAGTTGVRVLFGSVFGLSATDALAAALVALAVCAALLAIARPLLFATLDAAVAAARGVPTRALGLAFLVLVAVVAGEATQAVGALLLLGLLAAPAGAALRLTSRPWTGLALSAGIALACTWAGIALGYAIPSLPPSTAIVSLAAAAHVLAVVTERAGAASGLRRPGRPPRARSTADPTAPEST